MRAWLRWRGRVRDPPVWANPGSYPPDWLVSLSFLTNESLTQVTDEYGIHLCELSLDPISLIGHPPFIFDQWDVDSGDRRVRDPPVRAELVSYPPDWPVSLSFLTNEMLTQVTDEYGIHLCELSLDPSGQLTLRQLSALLLKQYIDAHWSQVPYSLCPLFLLSLGLIQIPYPKIRKL